MIGRLDERTLVDHIVSQRWYASKGREVAHAAIVDRAQLPGIVVALAEIHFADGTHEIYQLITGDEGVDRLVEPGVAGELVDLIRGARSHEAGDGTVEFHRVEGCAGLDGELSSARPIGTEQSNSSVVFDDRLILKVYRRIEPGINPELEMLRFLSEHGFANVPSLGGWYAYLGRPLEATLGTVQTFVPGGIDGWELALDELEEAPDRFLDRLGRLGEVAGEMHSTLASEPADPSFCPEDIGPDSLGLLTASIDHEIEQVFLDFPDDLEALEPLVGRAADIREQLRQRTHAGATGRIIRHHGDFHLGQTLLVENDWVLLDFEGEPARPLTERRRKRSPLRDVAAMLRSFAYAASAVEILRGSVAPLGWEERARERFLDGYLESVDQAIVPAGREAFDRLLSVFELEKAVYELRYELNMRPDWLGIPVAGILRMLEEPVTT